MSLINRALGVLGLKLQRLGNEGLGPVTDVSREESWQIGGVSLVFPPGSQLRATYASIPTYTSELARIAAIIAAKYPSMQVVDVGANVGDTAAMIRSRCSAPILCVEGDRATAEYLRRNAALIGGITIKQCYLSDHSRPQTVVVDKAGWNSTLLPTGHEGSGDTLSVDFYTLDDIVEGPVKLLKVDTEGYDPRILRGARATLDRLRPVVMFEHNRENLARIGEDNLSVFRQLKSHGYRSLLVWDAFGRFLLATSLDDLSVVEDLHEYVDFDGEPLSRATYLDVCAFHEEDHDIAAQCLATERHVRRARTDVTRPAVRPGAAMAAAE